MNENRQKNAAISILAGLVAPVIVIIFLLTTLVTIDAFSQPEGIRLAQSVQSRQITKEQSEIAKTIGEAGKEEAQTESIARASYLDSLERLLVLVIQLLLCIVLPVVLSVFGLLHFLRKQ